jgi:very-short-patch-repair endonuclease
MTAYRTIRSQLAAVALCAQLPDLENRPTDDVSRTLEALDSDRATLWQMPTIKALMVDFQQLGLLDLLQQAAQKNLTGQGLCLSFRRSWLFSLIDEFKLRIPELREFIGEQQSRRVREFKEADTKHLVTSAQRVRWAVAKKLREARDEYPAETRLLRDQANKKSRHLPLRRLVEQTSHVLLALRPCWAMSPLVVSKTLPAERLFDLVIFDEASQIPPHEAITSIARGRSLVVAGDDKQLPPTNFFSRMMEESEEADDEETSGLGDFESILTVMRSRLDQARLRWHYRSQDERLIAFSNREIYDDDLVTFPGASRETPVTVEVVNGIASPGQDGSSPAEVERVVQLVLEHAATRPEESLGVIAMSQKHADRVDRAIREALRDRPEFEEFFNEETRPGKRFFVKNLERVQGDERDAIVLTIGVAKRADGRLARTGFGPLNHAGGRRRLNVAITRAKRRMTVVTSFHPHDLAPSDEENGTELFRRYLDFACRHCDVEQVGRRENTELNGLEEDIYRTLTDHGVEVYPQWGFSGYRIDFALAHRDCPGRMVLAVEADGDSYHRAHSTRDRDRLRQNHLEQLGWRFHRIWASAWFADRGQETARVLEAWETAMAEGDREPPQITPPTSPVAENATRVERTARPHIPAGRKINEYTQRDLISICLWLMSDQLQIDREERIGQVLKELGFQRRGPRIVERLRAAVSIAQDYADKENP